MPVYNPGVTQHGIQDFIFKRPKDRYRAISDALGLTDLVEFKDIVEAARSAYRNTPPDRVVKAESVVKGLVGSLSDLDLDPIATRWRVQDFQVREDYDEIYSAVGQLVGKKAFSTTDELLASLKDGLNKAMQRVFDISPFRPRSDSHELLQSLAELGPKLTQSLQDLVQAVELVLRSTLAELEARRLEFWRTGLDLINEDPSRPCPFCDAFTVTPRLIQDRRKRIERGKTDIDAKANLADVIDNCEAVIGEGGAFLEQLRVKSLSPEDEAKLHGVFDRHRDQLEAFIRACQAFDSIAATIRDGLEELRQSVQGLLQRASENGTADIPGLARNIADCFQVSIQQFTEAFGIYQNAFTEFEPVLRVELADEAEVRKYPATIALITEQDSVRVCAINQQFEQELLERERLVTDHVKQKQKEVLNVREGEMLNWYRRLSPGSATTFSGIEPATDRFNLKADSFGTELSAPACLSHSQLNCLGLSIWISSVTVPLSPFQFLLFDDPVQSMDDEHTDSFIMDVVSDLIELTCPRLLYQS
jgi:hypothetical protein